MQPNDTPAFPVIGAPSAPEDYPGMTLRDYFAARALQGDWAAQSEYFGEFVNDTSIETLMHRARLYYRMADAMLKARQS